MLIQRIGLPLALFAALLIAACGGTQEIWTAETLVEEQPLEPVKFEETVTAGRLQLTVTQKVRAKETPIERLTLLHEESYADFDWDDAGLVFFSILGGIVSVGLYFLFAFVIYNPDDENK